MAIERGSWKVRVVCRGCGKRVMLWLEDIPARYRDLAVITDEGIARMRCQACGQTHPRAEICWAPGAFKAPKR